MNCVVNVAEAFGDWLREKREEARLRQSDLAESAGISKSYISTLERGGEHPLTGKEVRPAIDIVERLAIALRVPIDEARQRAGYAPAYNVAVSPLPSCDEVDPVFRSLLKGLDSDQKIEAANFLTELKERKRDPASEQVRREDEAEALRQLEER